MTRNISHTKRKQQKIRIVTLGKNLGNYRPCWNTSTKVTWANALRSDHETTFFLFNLFFLSTRAVKKYETKLVGIAGAWAVGMEASAKNFLVFYVGFGIFQVNRATSRICMKKKFGWMFKVVWTFGKSFTSTRSLLWDHNTLLRYIFVYTDVQRLCTCVYVYIKSMVRQHVEVRYTGNVYAARRELFNFHSVQPPSSLDYQCDRALGKAWVLRERDPARRVYPATLLVTRSLWERARLEYSSKFSPKSHHYV